MSLNQLSMILGLPDSDLKQIVDYANTLSKAEAADHFKNLLGDSLQSIEFISSFNSRRQDPKPVPAPARASASAPSLQPSSDADAPKRSKQAKKKKPAIHTPAPRQIIDVNPGPGTVYNKHQTDNDYIIGRGVSSASNNKQPSRTATPKPNKNTLPHSSATGAGALASDLLKPKHTPSPNPTSRSSTPGPSSAKPNAPKATKVSITGGTPMHGASGAVADLDAAIRALEMTTNPTLAGANKSNTTSSTAEPASRRCNCVATRHPLQTAAPNCLHCGKVVCLKEGLGPCTFCARPLLAAADVQALLRALQGERARSKQAADRAAPHRSRPDVAAPRSTGPAPEPAAHQQQQQQAAARARAHRDRLLGFQAQNARRTTVRDEAADFDVAGAIAGAGGGSPWASPEERARELKRQQRLLREMEWRAAPAYEKRQQVVSIDLVGRRVVKQFVAKERPRTPDDDDDAAGEREESHPNRGGGAFSRNPLLGGLLRPVYAAAADKAGKGVALEGRRDRAAGWRRVQDDLSDNEGVILDGGVYGGRDHAPTGSAGDEPGCG